MSFRQHGLSVLSLTFFLIVMAISVPSALGSDKGRVGRRIDLRLDNARQKYVPGEVLVRFRPVVKGMARQALHAQMKAKSSRQLRGPDGLELVTLAEGQDVQTAVRGYRRRAEVVFAEPNYYVHAFDIPDDPKFSDQWNLHNTGQGGGVVGADIGAVRAWATTTGSNDVVVAIIDTGIDYNHPDLAPNIYSHGVNYSGTGGDDALDDNGHGSHVGGIIGATGNNSLGVTGINWQVKLLPCKMLDSDGFGSIAEGVECFSYIREQKRAGANIVAINTSWGSAEYSEALQQAIAMIAEEGILVIAAAGNDTWDNDFGYSWPADYDIPNVISVASTNRFDRLSSFSNFGRYTVHLGAPGEQILSTVAGGNYEAWSGTSMAAPHVSAVAALLKAQNPQRDWKEIRNLILSGGDQRDSLAKTITGRRVSAAGALNCTDSVVRTRLLPRQSPIIAQPNSPLELRVLSVRCGMPAGPVQVTVEPSGEVLHLRDDGMEGDLFSGDGLYTKQWSPSAGVYSLQFPDEIVPVYALAETYHYNLPTYGYRDFTGTSLDLGDDSVAELALPFVARYAGTTFDRVYVSSNGTISFTDMFGDYFNSVLPLNRAVTLLAPLWQDLYPVRGTSQNVFWEVTGTAPNRELVIEWRDVRTYTCRNDARATVRFQVILKEDTDQIVFQYADAEFGGACSNQDGGRAGTIGLLAGQNETAWHRFGEPGVAVVYSGFALGWTPGDGGDETLPVPTLTAVAPLSLPTSTTDAIITVQGTNFTPITHVIIGTFNYGLGEWSAPPTTFISDTELRATLGATSYLTRSQLLQVGVATPWTSVMSDCSTDPEFCIQVTGEAQSNDLQLLSLEPASVESGSMSFVLTVSGTGFLPKWFWGGSDYTELRWNGSPRPSRHVSPDKLQALIYESDVRSEGTAQISVANVLSQTESNSLTFTITHPGGGAISRELSRFFGWRIADRLRNKDAYVKRFRRSHADAALAEMQRPESVNVNAKISTASLDNLPGLWERDSLPADYLPTDIAVGDLNGDGRQDWVIANGGASNIWIYLGRGDGTSELPRIVRMPGRTPLSVALADLRGSGVLDIVVANIDFSTVGVLLGKGDGTFAAMQEFSVTGSPTKILAGDFTGDGKLDVAVGLFDATTPALLLPGDGTGHLGAPLPQAPQYGEGTPLVWDMNSADLDGDGHLDLVVSDVAGYVDPNSSAPPVGTLWTFLNTGDGTFKATAIAGAGTKSLALVDVDTDTCLDVVAEGAWYKGDCSGAFALSSASWVYGDVAILDLNRDGKVDAVGADTSLYLAYGDGQGRFSGPKWYHIGGTAGYSYSALATGDLNGDGWADVISVQQDLDAAYVFLNDHTGAFPGPSSTYIPALGSSGAAIADVDGDGRRDLVTVRVPAFFSGENVNEELAVALNRANNPFQQVVTSAIADTEWLGGQGTDPWDQASPLDPLLADFRGTGRPDAVSVIVRQDQQGLVTSGLAFAANNGDGHFGRPTLTMVEHASGLLAAADFNRDGKLDFVSVGADGTVIEPINRVASFIGNADGTFTAGPVLQFKPEGLTTNAPNLRYRSIDSGDFNRDGNADVLVYVSFVRLSEPDYTGREAWFFAGKGDGSFAPGKVAISGIRPYIVADVNNDGWPDLVSWLEGDLNPDQGKDGWRARTQFDVYIGQSDGSFKWTIAYQPYTGIRPSVRMPGPPFAFARLQPWAGDYNHDGKLDLAAFQFTFWERGIVQFLAGNGDGTFTPTYNVYAFDYSPPLDNWDAIRANFTDHDELRNGWLPIPTAPAAPFQIRVVTHPVIGDKGVLRIAINAASSGARTIVLAASDPQISIAPSIEIPAGSLVVDVPFTIAANFDASRVFAFTGEMSGVKEVAYGTQVSEPGDRGVTITDFIGLAWGRDDIVVAPETENLSRIFSLSNGGYETQLTYRCEGLPRGLECWMDPPSVHVSPNSTAISFLHYKAMPGTSPGSYNFRLVGTDGTVEAAVTLPVYVVDFSATVSPSTAKVPVGSSAVFTLTPRSMTSVDITVCYVPLDLPDFLEVTFRSPGDTLPGSVQFCRVVLHENPFSDEMIVRVKAKPAIAVANSRRTSSHVTLASGNKGVLVLATLFVLAGAMVLRPCRRHCLMLLIAIGILGLIVSCGGGGGSSSNGGGGGGGDTSGTTVTVRIGLKFREMIKPITSVTVTVPN